MKHAALLLATSLLAGGANAADYGFGVALNSSSEIFVPVNLNSTLRIEPSLALDRADISFDSGPIERRFYELKAGVFLIHPVDDAFSILSGGRLGYLKQVQRDSITDETSAGYSIEPTLAVEYLPIKHLALGAEVLLRFSRLKPKSSQGFEFTETNTVTRITVKYFY